MEELAAKPPSASRVTLAILTDPGQANAFGTIHGGVLLRLADECGAAAALRHSGRGIITTAALDSMTFLGPVRVGERVELSAVVTFVGRTSIEARIEIHAEPMGKSELRKVGVGYGLYVALDPTSGRPLPVPALHLESDAEHRAFQAARARQEARLARRAEAREEGE